MTELAVGAPSEPLAPGYPLWPGYRIAEHIARGRKLDVYTVWSAAHGCLCVAKTLRSDCAADTDARDRLLAEGRLVVQFAHPHLVRGYETHDGVLPVVILELLGGQTLSHLIEHRRQGLHLLDLVELGVQLCSVVGYLHRNGWLHLDLKTSNIIAEAGRARLIDLSHLRRPGPCPPGFGTAQYMAPEQLLGTEVTTATDVYGLGGVLFRMATRHRPFGRKERDADPCRPAALSLLRRRRLPREFTTVVAGCLEVDPAARPTLPEAAEVFDHAVCAEKQPASDTTSLRCSSPERP